MKKKYSSSYDDCASPYCENQTNHVSGLCGDCRAETCAVCSVRFTAKNINWDKPVCAQCRRNEMNRKHQLEAGTIS